MNEPRKSEDGDQRSNHLPSQTSALTTAQLEFAAAIGDAMARLSAAETAVRRTSPVIAPGETIDRNSP
jgi:hypothetical protein